MIELALIGIAVLIFDLFLTPEQKRWNAWLALFGVAVSAGAVTYRIVYHPTLLAGADSISAFGGAVIMDRFAIYFFYLFLAGAAVAILMSVKYLEIERENHGEFYALILFSVVGMMGMACGHDIVLLFISLELMALSTYVLVGFLRRDQRSNEAALKYLLLGAFSSGIFAYGLSLFYGLSGSTNIRAIAQALESHYRNNPNDPVAILALITVATGVLFKVAAVPFHQWAPDAYEGAPTTITGYMSVAVKAAGWVLLLRIFLYMLYPLRPAYVPMLIFVSIATMTGGNLAALTQDNTKRLLAYSSISHVGYMLLGLVAGTAYVANPTGIKGILVYLLVYTFMNLGAFAVITSLRRRDIIGDNISDLDGLMQKAPTEAILMLIFLLSLAGIPPLAGFYGKYFIFLSLMETGHYTLAAVAVLYAVLGLYYYLKIANAMLMRPVANAEPIAMSAGLRLALAITGIATVGIGLLPDVFIKAVNWSLSTPQASSIANLVGR